MTKTELDPPDGSLEERAEALYAEHLAARDRDEPADLAGLCAAHPSLAAELRELEADRLACERVSAVLRPHGGGASADVGSGVRMPDERERAELLAALARRSPREWPYQAPREIGRGTFGIVEEVVEPGLRRRVAKKTLRTARGSGEADRPRREDLRLHRFLDEAQVLGQLNHPGIVTVHAMGVDPEGRPYFTMQLVSGVDFAHVIERVHAGDEDWSLTRALEVVLKVCDALAYAHSRGVVHRDLKPEHLRVGRFGETYILDWGLARVLGRPDARGRRAAAPSGVVARSQSVVETDRRAAAGATPGSPLVTQDGTALGTPAYMSPEQARGELRAVGPASDVFSVGAILYHLLTGRAPYVPPGTAPSPETVRQLLLDGPPRPLHELAPAVPPELQAVCERAMAREPGARYPDMHALASDLRAFLEGRVVAAFETGAWAELRKWVRRNRGAALSFAALFALVLGLVATLAGVNTRLRASEEVTAQLAAAGELEQLVQRWHTLPAASPETAGRYRELLDGLEALLARRDGFARVRAELRRRGVGAPRPAYAADALDPLVPSEGWEFDDPKLQSQHDGLDALVDALDGVAHPGGLLDAARRATRRAETLATAVAEATGVFGWEDAAAYAASASPYGGLTLLPQTGLVPLGPDPDSGLLEFALVGSGDLPARDPDGALRHDGHGALVLVLLPGGPALVGARTEVDELAEPDEVLSTTLRAPQQARLAPFLLGKHELSRAQAAALGFPVPPLTPYDARLRVDDAHPLTRVSWVEARELLRPFGLDLPSEAQLEYGSRGRTDGPFYFSAPGETELPPGDVAQLHANVADASFERAGLVPGWFTASWDDGWPATAPIGTFRANPFGLHDVVGNVYEWCLDAYYPGGYAEGARGALEGPRQVVPDPGPPVPGRPSVRMVRGGNWYFPLPFGRSANRFQFASDMHSPFLGVRVARDLETAGD